MSCKIFAFSNQKGGVGKTTSCVNVAAGLAFAKKRVLLVDLDPQGNATMGSGVDKTQAFPTINEVLLGKSDVGEAAVGPTPANYDVLPANGDLTEAEVHLARAGNAHGVLKEALARVADDYDFIVMDCPPSLNMLTLNAMVAATSVIIPMQCEYYALEGLSALLDTVQRVRDTVNPALQVEGILRTMYDPRNSLTNEVSAQLHQHFGDRLYRTVIPRNVRLAEAPSFGLPALQYDAKSRGAKAYLALAGEMLRRAESQSQNNEQVQVQVEEQTEVTQQVRNQVESDDGR